MKSSKYWVVVCLIVAATVVLRVRGDVDKVPDSTPLSAFPQTMGPWGAVDVPLDAETLEVLGKGFFLNRMYSVRSKANSPSGADVDAAAPPVGLFIGYFPTQRTGQSIHSPQHCLPGAGWVFERSGVTTLKSGEGKDIQVGEYIIANGPNKAEVLYWYRSHGRSISDDYKAKLYTLADSIRYSRTDAALVRIVTTVSAKETPLEAHQRAVAFAETMNPMLSAFIPN